MSLYDAETAEQLTEHFDWIDLNINQVPPELRKELLLSKKEWKKGESKFTKRLTNYYIEYYQNYAIRKYLKLWITYCFHISMIYPNSGFYANSLNFEIQRLMNEILDDYIGYQDDIKSGVIKQAPKKITEARNIKYNELKNNMFTKISILENLLSELKTVHQQLIMLEKEEKSLYFLFDVLILVADDTIKDIFDVNNINFDLNVTLKYNGISNEKYEYLEDFEQEKVIQIIRDVKTDLNILYVKILVIIHQFRMNEIKHFLHYTKPNAIINQDLYLAYKPVLSPPYFATPFRINSLIKTLIPKIKNNKNDVDFWMDTYTFINTIYEFFVIFSFCVDYDYRTNLEESRFKANEEKILKQKLQYTKTNEKLRQELIRDNQITKDGKIIEQNYNTEEYIDLENQTEYSQLIAKINLVCTNLKYGELTENIKNNIEYILFLLILKKKPWLGEKFFFSSSVLYQHVKACAEANFNNMDKIIEMACHYVVMKKQVQSTTTRDISSVDLKSITNTTAAIESLFDEEQIQTFGQTLWNNTFEIYISILQTIVDKYRDKTATSMTPPPKRTQVRDTLSTGKQNTPPTVRQDTPPTVKQDTPPTPSSEQTATSNYHGRVLDLTEGDSY